MADNAKITPKAETADAAAESGTKGAQAAAAVAKADTSAATPSGGAGKASSKPKPKPNPKSQIPTGIVYYVDEDGNLVKDGKAQGLSAEEVLTKFFNGLDEEGQDETIAQVNYAAQVNGKIEYFELSERRELVLTPVDPESL